MCQRLVTYPDRSRGISIRIRTNGTAVLIRAPIDGVVVWSDVYRRSMPPLQGREKGLNDELTWAMMIQDAWGFVHQLLGLDEKHVLFDVGDRVKTGDVIGLAPSTPLSAMPPSKRPPLDVPVHYQEEGYEPYPFRFRKLEIRVARPHRHWTRYMSPDADGWSYFNPLLMYVRGRAPPVMIPPFMDVSTLVFAPSTSVEVPHAFPAYSGKRAIPIPSSKVDVFVRMQAFVESPGDAADAMDPVTPYAMDWAVQPVVKGAPKTLCTAKDVYWRRSFEHSKLELDDTSLDDASFMYAYYVPRLSVGSFMRGSIKLTWNSQFHENTRDLIYAVTRTTLGYPDVRGAWNVARPKDVRDGPSSTVYRVAVRARSLTSSYTCIEEEVHVAPNQRTALLSYVRLDDKLGAFGSIFMLSLIIPLWLTHYICRFVTFLFQTLRRG